MDRAILHCDCNSFFASVETVLDPALAAGPMAVCGDPESRHGIILAKNEAAKRFGIQTAETIWQAKRKCPSLRLVRPHREQYLAFSARVNEIYNRYTDLVEPFGIDESWLDITGSMHLFGTPVEIADRLRAEVRSETGLTISVGVSFNKTFAKLGSDYKKPDATTVIGRGDVARIVWPLPVQAMLYVGGAAQKELNALYIETIGQLAHADRQMLARRLGHVGELLHDYANGLDDAPVRPAAERREVKSVGNGTTFRRDLLGEGDVRTGIAILADEVAMRLRKKGFCCRTVQLSIRDTTFHTITRRQTLERPTSLARELTGACLALYRANWDARKPIRMLTVTAMNLLPTQCEFEEQTSFFDGAADARDRQRRLEQTLDALRRKYGADALTSAAVLGADFLGGDPADGDKIIELKGAPHS